MMVVWSPAGMRRCCVSSVAARLRVHRALSTKSWALIHELLLVLDFRTAMKTSVKALKHHLCLNALIDGYDSLE